MKVKIEFEQKIYHQIELELEDIYNLPDKSDVEAYTIAVLEIINEIKASTPQQLLNEFHSEIVREEEFSPIDIKIKQTEK